ncbi:MAG: hypothetical protein ROZ64_05190 [Burkholderiaceae bacterium]|nr:hypothetical protein [Burkholderiaceae bacterium]
MSDPDVASTVDTLWLLALAFAVVGLAAILAGLGALARLRLGRFALRSLPGALLLAIGVLCGALAGGLHGYRALTHEEAIAQITVEPIGEQRFEALFRFADGRQARYELAGDEIQVDARILKWKPFANLIGLHTLWTLDRVAGRYRSLDDERSHPRTVHPLQGDPLVDLFALRRRFASLAPLYDAEYGSASFVPADTAARYELRVSTTGLLIRPLA